MDGVLHHLHQFFLLMPGLIHLDMYLGVNLHQTSLQSENLGVGKVPNKIYWGGSKKVQGPLRGIRDSGAMCNIMNNDTGLFSVKSLDSMPATKREGSMLTTGKSIVLNRYIFYGL